LLSVKYSYKEALYATVGVTLDIFFFCIHQFALHRQQPEKDKHNVDFAPLEKFLRTPMAQNLKCTEVNGFLSVRNEYDTIMRMRELSCENLEKV